MALHPELVRHWRAGRCAFKPVGVIPPSRGGDDDSDMDVNVIVEFR